MLCTLTQATLLLAKDYILPLWHSCMFNVKDNASILHKKMNKYRVDKEYAFINSTNVYKTYCSGLLNVTEQGYATKYPVVWVLVGPQ